MLKEYKGELAFLAIALIFYLILAAFDVSSTFVYLAVVFGFFGLCIAWNAHPLRITPCI